MNPVAARGASRPWTSALWLSCVGLSCASCAAQQPPAAQSAAGDCAQLDTDAERVWGIDAKARVKSLAPELGVELEAKNVSRITTKLDRISGDWVRMRGELCRDHEGGRLSSSQYAERSRCLDDALIRMRTLVTILHSGGLRDADAMMQASDRVSQGLAACGHAGTERAPASEEGAADDPRGITLKPAAATPAHAPPAAGAANSPAIYARSIAVVIGVDDYLELPDLQAAEADAQAVASNLQGRGFEVELLLGALATRERISALLGDELPRKLAANDRVLVFFAGHGVSVGQDERAMGYLMPVAAKPTLPVATGISMTELQGWLGGYVAKHVMFVADACYSGLALPHRGLTVERSGEQLLRMATRERVRFTLVAGQDNQEAWEMLGARRGAFTHFFLQALDGEADANRDRLITASEVAGYVSDRVFGYVWQQFRSEQRPTSASSGRGEFIFFWPNDPPWAKP